MRFSMLGFLDLRIYKRCPDSCRLGACPSNRRGRVPGPAGADASRREEGE
jgi:hypothetical protein